MWRHLRRRLWRASSRRSLRCRDTWWPRRPRLCAKRTRVRTRMRVRTRTRAVSGRPALAESSQTSRALLPPAGARTPPWPPARSTRRGTISSEGASTAPERLSRRAVSGGSQRIRTSGCGCARMGTRAPTGQAPSSASSTMMRPNSSWRGAPTRSCILCETAARATSSTPRASTPRPTTCTRRPTPRARWYTLNPKLLTLATPRPATCTRRPTRRARW
mmetsp:Transcript_35963/g.85483  ORF Transcript_35963/g.85483 Transcript_35963/m.85483 type:complete len:218 (-) Transcript_35963:169-822(-)